MGAHLIFQFCSALYQRVALIITTNLRFADWTQVFGDERLTAALLDRLTHKTHILEFTGAESYRLRERMQREAREERQAVGKWTTAQPAVAHLPTASTTTVAVESRWFPFRVQRHF